MICESLIEEPSSEVIKHLAHTKRVLQILIIVFPFDEVLHGDLVAQQWQVKSIILLTVVLVPFDLLDGVMETVDKLVEEGAAC